MLNLSKNQSAINLTKSVPNTTKYQVGLAWDNDADYDASVVVLAGGKRSDLVYYGNKSGAGIQHAGDARDGAALGDDETISIDLSQVRGDEVVVVITSYNSGNFKASDNPVARLYKDGEPKALVEANLAVEAAFGTALELVRFFKESGDWKFENISATLGDSANGLEDVVAKYQA